MAAEYQIYDHWRDVPKDKWPWPNFTPFEMRCRGTDRLIVVPAFMDRLQGLRTLLGKPLLVSSAYRDPSYNAKVSSTGRMGPHTTGRAIDLLVYGERAYHVAGSAYAAGFTGIGLRQEGAFNHRFIHLDDLDTVLNAHRPTVWTYT
ncbi:hypothetical protein LCGC14_2344220 [marine sediment metagenome]